MSKNANIMLVHGAWADGSCWSKVILLLQAKGFKVTSAQIPLTSLDNDIEVTRRLLSDQPEPTVLVGHSYGGAVITEAGDTSNVKALVYVTAFAPDAGESVKTLTSNSEPGAPVPPIVPPKDGYLMLDAAKFPASFAEDLPLQKAQFMAASQVPWGVNAYMGAITQPAWKIKPSWYLVVTEDRMIPVAVQRMMAKRANATVVETKGSHAIYVSNPKMVASIIEQAARSVETSSK